jgi:hypothetical protein
MLPRQAIRDIVRLRRSENGLSLNIPGISFQVHIMNKLYFVCDSRDGVGHSSLRDAVSVHPYTVKRIVGLLPVTSPRRLRRPRSGQTRAMGWQYMILPGAWIDACLTLVSFILFSIGRGLIIGRSPSEEPTNCIQIYIFSINLMWTEGLIRHIWKRRVRGYESHYYVILYTSLIELQKDERCCSTHSESRAWQRREQIRPENKSPWECLCAFSGRLPNAGAVICTHFYSNVCVSLNQLNLPRLG